jgi:8-oxo-dGTP pyrophosphatase MutT (NUDIX family)
MTKLVNYPEQYAAPGPHSPYGISSGCIVYKETNNRVEVLLLIRNREDGISYHLPKGTVHIDETLESAALRETKEEAGVEAGLVTYLGASICTYTYESKVYDKTFHYYAAKFIKDLGVIDHEHDGKTWVSTKEAIEMLDKTSPDKRESEIVKRLKKFLGN